MIPTELYFGVHAYQPIAKSGSTDPSLDLQASALKQAAPCCIWVELRIDPILGYDEAALRYGRMVRQEHGERYMLKGGRLRRDINAKMEG